MLKKIILNFIPKDKALQWFRHLPLWAQSLTLVAMGRKEENQFIRKIIANQMLPTHRYGTQNEGNLKWQKKWDTTELDKRILMIAPKDYAGSMYKWAEALNRHTDYAVRLVTFHYHPYGYNVDLVLPECNAARLEKFLELVSQAGILHLKDEHSWFMGLPAFTNTALLNTLFFSDLYPNKPKFFTHYGGYARKFKDNPEYIKAVQSFDGRIAMTPDLNFEWFSGEYIPHAIDADNLFFSWADSDIIAHSPSSPEKKGTDMFTESLNRLKHNEPEKWAGWTYDLIHGVSHQECVERKQKCSLFFDQAGRHSKSELGIDDVIGFYGNSAIEAMVYGIPTIAHISERAFEGAKRAGIDLSDTPVLNMDRSTDGLYNKIVDFINMSKEERFELASKTRSFVLQFHDYKAVAKRLAEQYGKAIQAAKTQEKHA